MTQFQPIYVVTIDGPSTHTKGQVVGAFDAIDVALALLEGHPNFKITEIPLICCDRLLPVKPGGTGCHKPEQFTHLSYTPIGGGLLHD